MHSWIECAIKNTEDEMFKNQFIRTVFLTIAICIFPIFGQTLEENPIDKTMSPFFFVQSRDAAIDQLPLKETSASVTISGVIADVKVRQVYANEGTTTLEAIYIFPASTRAAVYAMKMTVGERVIQAKIAEREKARAEYTQALAEGRTASLLEQQRPNVFQMNVGNILPGDEIIVELYYTELLISEDQQYEFVYPTVVGPRYSNQLESETPSNEHWVKNPYLKTGSTPPFVFDMDVTLSAGLPIKEITSASHDVTIHYTSKEKAEIDLTSSLSNHGDRDFILKYRLAGETVRPGLLLYEGEKENFFLLMLQPPKRIRPEQIPGREYIFIVDVSGSMNGFPLDISKKLLRDLIGNLKPSDRFNVLLFAAGSNVLAEQSLQATEANISKAIRLIDQERGGGGTELLPALKRALALPKSENYSRTVVIATDGYVNVEKETFDLIRGNLGEANMFAFGIGSSVNRYLIEGIARAGMGESFVITNTNGASQEADKFRKYIATPVLTNISYQIDDLETYDVEPQSIPDVLAERPVIIFGKWRGARGGTITVRGNTGGGQPYYKQIKVSDYQPEEKNNALVFLWARHKVALLNDYNHVSSDPDLIKEITDLGLRYNLLTEYTSFVATDTKIRTTGGESVTVKQPLPLPYGVSNMALSGFAGSAGGAGGWKKAKHYQSAPRLAELDVQVEALPEVKSAAAKVVLNQVYTSDTATEKEIQSFVDRKIDDLIHCYQNSQVPNKSGNLLLELVFDSKGYVKEINLITNDLQDKSLSECFKSVILAWKFRAKTIVSESTITLEFNLGFN
jgi:Ca-activated chloride channel family protein